MIKKIALLGMLLSAGVSYGMDMEQEDLKRHCKEVAPLVAEQRTGMIIEPAAQKIQVLAVGTSIDVPGKFTGRLTLQVEPLSLAHLVIEFVKNRVLPQCNDERYQWDKARGVNISFLNDGEHFVGDSPALRGKLIGEDEKELDSFMAPIAVASPGTIARHDQFRAIGVPLLEAGMREKEELRAKLKQAEDELEALRARVADDLVVVINDDES